MTPLLRNDEPSVASSSPSNKSVTQRKRRIVFSSKPHEVFPIPHIRDLPKAEIKAIWYERQDYEAMKQSFIPLVRSMMKDEPVEENNEQSIRGLEYRTRKGAIRRQHNKLEAISAVLDEQDRQYNEGLLDNEILSKIYRSCSSHCLEEAYMLGLKDEATAKDLFNEPELTETEVSSEDEQVDLDESEEEQEGDSSSHEEKKLRRLGKLFKQVRIRRRALDEKTIDSPAVVKSILQSA